MPLGILFTAAALWPFLERWITGDKREHHVLDRPRNAATRTAIGIAVITWYGIMWLEGANDVVAQHLEHLAVPDHGDRAVRRVHRAGGRLHRDQRICLGLQRKDAAMLLHGYETGIIYQRPSGEFVEVHAPVPEETKAGARGQVDRPAAARGGCGRRQRRARPGHPGPVGRLRLALNHVVTESVPLPVGNGHGTNGHGNGHGANGHGTGGAR